MPSENGGAAQPASDWENLLRTVSPYGHEHTPVILTGDLADDSITVSWVHIDALCGDGVCSPDEIYFYPEWGLETRCPEDCKTDQGCGADFLIPRYMALGQQPNEFSHAVLNLAHLSKVRGPPHTRRSSPYEGSAQCWSIVQDALRSSPC